MFGSRDWLLVRVARAISKWYDNHIEKEKRTVWEAVVKKNGTSHKVSNASLLRLLIEIEKLMGHTVQIYEISGMIVNAKTGYEVGKVKETNSTS